MALRQTLENEVSVAYESATSKRSSYIPLDHGEKRWILPSSRTKNIKMKRLRLFIRRHNQRMVKFSHMRWKQIKKSTSSRTKPRRREKRV
jgi:hypothetical protein